MVKKSKLLPKDDGRVTQLEIPRDEVVSNYFLPYQREWILDKSTLKLCLKSRRTGYSYGASFEVNDDCVSTPESLWWITSRDEETAKLFITDYIRKWAQLSNVVCHGLMGENYDVIDTDKGMRAFVVTYENGSRIISLSSTPEVFAGKGGKILADELDLHKNAGKVIDMAMPCIQWGGTFNAISALSVDGGPQTPFYRLCEDAQADNPMGWSFHKTSIVDAVNQGLVEKINAVSKMNWTREEWLKVQRARCRTQQAWDTQFMMIPSTDGESLLPYEMIMQCEVKTEQLKRIPDGFKYAGYDVGREHDLAVYFELTRLGDVLWQSGYQVFPKTRYRIQEDFLRERLKDPKLAHLCIDEGGIGDMLHEYLSEDFGSYRVEGCKFSNPLKNILAPPVRAIFEDRRIRIMADGELRADLHKIKKTRTPTGLITYDAERDDAGHSDRFWALALACYAAGRGDSGPMRIMPASGFGAPKDNDISGQNAVDDDRVLQNCRDWSRL